MTTNTIYVPGRPVPKARPRVTRRGTYTPAKTKAYELAVGLSWDGPCFEGDVAVELRFDLPNYKRVDIDNLIKSVLDGLNGRAYKDDGQVVRVIANKRVFPEEPGTWGTVWEV